MVLLLFQILIKILQMIKQKKLFLPNYYFMNYFPLWINKILDNFVNVCLRKLNINVHMNYRICVLFHLKKEMNKDSLINIYLLEFYIYLFIVLSLGSYNSICQWSII